MWSGGKAGTHKGIQNPYQLAEKLNFGVVEAYRQDFLHLSDRTFSTQ